MKVISIQQPWASLIITQRSGDPTTGIKNIENRTWATKFRGRVLVHACLKEDLSWIHGNLYDKIHEGIEIHLTKEEYRGTFGAIIGSVEIVDCVIGHHSVWARNCVITVAKKGDEKAIRIYNWVLANPIKFDKPIPCKGKQGFWNYEL